MASKKIFSCEQGSLYKLPLANTARPMVKLRIGRNLGHNAIETQCELCGKVDTYAKSALEEGKVYLCKHCGKKSSYINKLANLRIEKIYEKTKDSLVVKCKCNDCGTVADYPINSILSGSIQHCVNCYGGFKQGKKIGRLEITKLVPTQDDSDAQLAIKCNDCSVEKTSLASKLAQAILRGTDIEKLLPCECNKKTQQQQQQKKTQQKKVVSTKQIQQKAQQQTLKTSPALQRALNKLNPQIQKINELDKTEFYKDIESVKPGDNMVKATCRFCDITKRYSIQDILDDEPCDICKGLMVDDEIASKKLGEQELNKLRFSEKGKEHLKKINNRMSLVISDMTLIKSEFEEARSAGKRFKPIIGCTCNNCLNESSYSVSNIDTDIAKCNICDFEVIPGTLVKHFRDEFEIIGLSRRDNKTYVDTACTRCGSTISIVKADYSHSANLTCYVCQTREKYNIQNKSIVGDIFAYEPVSEVAGYEKVGKYIVLENRYTDGKYNIKAQCSECGEVLEAKFTRIEEFYEKYSNNYCGACDSILATTKNYINNNNWIGYIKNCRIIKEIRSKEDVKIAKVECLLCHDIVEVPLTVFLYSNNSVCEKCMNTKVILKCPLCHQVHDNKTVITLKKLYDNDSETVICPVKNKKVDISKYRYANEQQSHLDYLFDTFDSINTLERVPGDSGLIEIKDKFYVGMDGEKYYTCYCERHNKMMTLRRDEIPTYKHLYCADTRMYGYL